MKKIKISLNRYIDKNTKYAQTTQTQISDIVQYIKDNLPKYDIIEYNDEGTPNGKSHTFVIKKSEPWGNLFYKLIQDIMQQFDGRNSMNERNFPGAEFIKSIVINTIPKIKVFFVVYGKTDLDIHIDEY